MASKSTRLPAAPRKFHCQLTPFGSAARIQPTLLPLPQSLLLISTGSWDQPFARTQRETVKSRPAEKSQ